MPTFDDVNLNAPNISEPKFKTGYKFGFDWIFRGILCSHHNREFIEAAQVERVIRFGGS